MQKATFHRDGRYWTVGYVRNAVRLKDARGLRYLARLLRYPGAEFHALELYGDFANRHEDETNRWLHVLPPPREDLEKSGIHINGLSDAGELLDNAAKMAYRRRLAELREDLEEAKIVGKIEVAAQAEEEIDALIKELSRAVGLHGRDRRAASASERARQSVTKSIKAALDLITRSEASLGAILSKCIKTGTFCSYQPDPGFPIAWEFAKTTVEQSDPKNAASDITEPTRAAATSPPLRESAPTRARSLFSKPSLLVLPFLNMSGDPEQEYFSDGITEDIIVDLSQVLFVVTRNTAFTFKSKAVELPQLARELNVRYLLKGTVRRDENRVRVTAQLIDGATGGSLWAERYDREFSDVLALQDNITQNVVAALKVRLLPAETKLLAEHSSAAAPLRMPSPQLAPAQGDDHRQKETGRSIAMSIASGGLLWP